jgi:hypothetical protein
LPPSHLSLAACPPPSPYSLFPGRSVESWLALRFNEQAFYFQTLRETYEGACPVGSREHGEGVHGEGARRRLLPPQRLTLCTHRSHAACSPLLPLCPPRAAFVLYEFYMLMLAFLGGRKKLAERLAAKPKERARHPWPFSICFRGWRLGSRFVHRCTVGVYQYV